MSVVGMCRLVRDLERQEGLVAETLARPSAVLARYPLTEDERAAVLDLDAERLVTLGLNPLPMRNLVTLLGVPNPDIYTHQLSLRPAAKGDRASAEGTPMSLWTDTLGAEVRFHQAGPWRTRALEAGSGDHHVILLSGITGHVEGWSRNVLALAEQGLHVHAIDALGHGFTDKPTDIDYIAPNFAAHVIAFMDALGIERADLVGQSLGGWIALYTAKAYPDRVGKLVHVTGAGILLDEQARAEEAKKVGDAVATVTQRALEAPSRETVRTRLEWLMYRPETVTDELVETRYKIYCLPDSQAAMPKLVAEAPGAANRPYMLTEADLAALPHETLVLWSDHNPTTPPEVGRRAAEIMPDATFEMIDDCGHWPMFEQPEAFNRVVGAFLTKGK